MSRKLLIVTLHPGKGSFSHAIAERAAAAATAAGAEIRRSDLAEMSFDIDFGQSGYRQAKPLEPDLETFMSDLEWCRHAIFVSPMWWGGLPAKAKGLFDRALLPGRAFDPRVRRFGLPKPLLAGRTARLILTSDTPDLYFRLVYAQAMRLQVQRQIFKFVGLSPAGYRHFAAVEHSTAGQRATWLEQVARDVLKDVQGR